MEAFIRVVRQASRATGVLAAFLIVFAVLAICDMVVERYGFNRTTIWQIDVVTYCIVGATFIGSPYVLLHRGHVNVDVLPLWLSPRPRFWLACFTVVLSTGFIAVLWWLTTAYWLESYQQNWKSNTVWRARLWVPYLSMPVGLGLLLLQYVVELVCLLTGREPPFGIDGERKLA